MAMGERTEAGDWLVQRFEADRPRLRAIAYRMLGSLTEADDAVQETWLRLSQAETAEIGNLAAWLTTVVGRVCLNVLRSRRTHREDSLESHVPEPIVGGADGPDPEQAVLLGDLVGLALVVVMDTLSPAERLAFVLHDLFAVPFAEVAEILGRSTEATRQLASRARRRVRGARTDPDADLNGQRAVVDAFLAAARGGDFDALLRVLDPDAVLRSDGGARIPTATAVIRGARGVAEGAVGFARLARFAQPVTVNGAAGLLVAPSGRPYAVIGMTVRGGRIRELDILIDPDRIARLDLSAITPGRPGTTAS